VTGINELSLVRCSTPVGLLQRSRCHLSSNGAWLEHRHTTRFW